MIEEEISNRGVTGEVASVGVLVCGYAIAARLFVGLAVISAITISPQRRRPRPLLPDPTIVRLSRRAFFDREPGLLAKLVDRIVVALAGEAGGFCDVYPSARSMRCTLEMWYRTPNSRRITSATRDSVRSSVFP